MLYRPFDQFCLIMKSFFVFLVVSWRFTRSSHDITPWNKIANNSSTTILLVIIRAFFYACALLCSNSFPGLFGACLTKWTSQSKCTWKKNHNSISFRSVPPNEVGTREECIFTPRPKYIASCTSEQENIWRYWRLRNSDCISATVARGIWAYKRRANEWPL